MKRVIVLLLTIVCCLDIAVPTWAAQTDDFSGTYPRVVDQGELLTDREETELNELLDEISVRQKMDVTVATAKNTAGVSVQEYADRLYEQWDFGYGAQKDGVMLLISIEERDWYISTCGYGITVFTDTGLDYIGEQIAAELSEGAFAEAFTKYAKLCDRFVTKVGEGATYKESNLPREPLSWVWIPLSLVVGFVIGLIVVGQMKTNMRSVRPQKTANNYVIDGSMNVSERRDLFLYHTVTRTPRPKNTGSSGSKTHRSSSGRSHGGRGGKF